MARLIAKRETDTNMEMLSVRDGYARWAETYDQEENPLIRLEERAVTALMPGAPTWVLDAACGTGRHAIRFALAGSRVLGIDDSWPMLMQAQVKARRLALGSAQFVRGRIDEPLPIRRRSFDLAVCGLALCHVRDLRRAVEGLCAAVEPGGHLLITDLHPEAVSCGLVTLFSDGGVERAIETEHHTTHDYIAALKSAGVVIVAERNMRLGEAFAREPRGLPAAAYERGWRDLPFCLAFMGRVS